MSVIATPTHRIALAGFALVALVGTASGCGSGSSDGASTTTAATTTTVSEASATTSTTGSPSLPGTSTTTSPGVTATTVARLPNASEAQRSAPGDGTGTALLRGVRVGRNAGFERIVFEFAGTSVPGYRVEWVDGPILADGSGEPIEVEGDAYLEIVMEPASGVDLSAPQLTIVYEGPDRVATPGQAEVLTDLVRTGDFEAVLTWVAGATQRAPFRVLRLTNPTRLVIDVESP